MGWVCAMRRVHASSILWTLGFCVVADGCNGYVYLHASLVVLQHLVLCGGCVLYLRMSLILLGVGSRVFVWWVCAL